MAKKISGFILSCIVLLATLPARAAEPQQIIIQDSSGITRSTSTVESLGRVDFSVMDASGKPADGAIVTLTNKETGKKLSSTAALGIASFDNVGAGTWTVASTNAGLTFTHVSIAAVGAAAAGTTVSTGVVGGTILGVLAVGGGATAIALGVDNGSSDNHRTDPLSPSS